MPSLVSRSCVASSAMAKLPEELTAIAGVCGFELVSTFDDIDRRNCRLSVWFSSFSESKARDWECMRSGVRRCEVSLVLSNGESSGSFIDNIVDNWGGPTILVE